VNTFLTNPTSIVQTKPEEDSFLAYFLSEPSKRGLVSWQIPFEEKPELSSTMLGEGGMGIIAEGEKIGYAL
jgi:hypothetical protein